MQRALPIAVAGGTYVPWGMLAAIDLHGGDRSRLADPDSIRRFVPTVIDAIGMCAHGPLITIHADEVSGRCFVDVFSCRPFDPDVAAAIAVEPFGGTPTLRVLQR